MLDCILRRKCRYFSRRDGSFMSECHPSGPLRRNRRVLSSLADEGTRWRGVGSHARRSMQLVRRRANAKKRFSVDDVVSRDPPAHPTLAYDAPIPGVYGSKHGSSRELSGSRSWVKIDSRRCAIGTLSDSPRGLLHSGQMSARARDLRWVPSSVSSFVRGTPFVVASRLGRIANLISPVVPLRYEYVPTASRLRVPVANRRRECGAPNRRNPKVPAVRHCTRSLTAAVKSSTDTRAARLSRGPARGKPFETIVRARGFHVLHDGLHGLAATLPVPDPILADARIEF